MTLTSLGFTDKDSNLVTKTLKTLLELLMVIPL